MGEIWPYLLLAVLLFSRFAVLVATHDIGRHLCLAYTLLICFWFQVAIPIWGWLDDVNGLHGNYLRDYYDDAGIIYLSMISSLILGYSILSPRERRSTSESGNEPSPPETVSKTKTRFALASVLLLYAIFGKFDGVTYEDPMGGDSSSVNYILALIETFPALILIALIARVTKFEIVVWILIASAIFVFIGFRYRIVLLYTSLLFFGVLGGFTVPRSARLMILSISVLALSGTVFVTTIIRGELRGAGISGVARHSELASEYYEEDSIRKILFDTSRNYLSTMSLLKYMEISGEPHGFGETMFGHIAVRALPAFVFKDGKKPRPPSVDVSAASWGTDAGFFVGEAYDFFGQVYYEFGAIGGTLFTLLTGAVLRRIQNSLNRQASSGLGLAMAAVFAATLFHFFSRGYLPAYIETLVYSLSPFMFIRFMRA